MPPLSLPVFRREKLDNSILSCLNRCPRLCFFNYVLNRASCGKSWPIQYGVAYHKFRETLEKLYFSWCVTDGKDLEEVSSMIYETSLAMALKDWENPPLEHTKSYLDESRITKACHMGFESWKANKISGNMKILHSEMPFELPLPSGRIFCGRMDESIEWNNRLWIGDYKTLGRKPKGGNWKGKFNPDHQFSGYVWAGQELSGRRIDGVIVSIVYNVKATGPEFHTALATRTKEDLGHWHEWVEDSYDLYERYFEKDSWPMNTTACDDWGGCFFRNCCNAGQWSAIEQWLLDNTLESHWDPLDPDKEKGLPE